MMNGPTDKVPVVFTAKSIDRILEEEGTSSWRLDPNRARQCSFAVCTRNAYSKQVEGREAHRSAFLVGKIKDVVPSRTSTSPGRYLIQFSEFAHVNIPDAWKGDRNPVKYSTLQELGIDPSLMKWQAMPEPSGTSMLLPTTPSPLIEAQSAAADVPLTLTQAKKGLALAFGVEPEAIEITIHG
jgi:hypothetical protein